MSHKASNWLSELPADAMSGGEFRVMFHLCDAHNSKRDPHTACFPQQEALRKATGLSNGGLNRALNRLEEAGFIMRVRATEPDSPVRRTYYILGCDLDDAQEQTPLSGDRANSTFEGWQTPLFEGANSTPVELHIKDEPVRTCKNQETGARTSFSEFWAVWPNKTAKASAEKAWKRLGAGDRADAIGNAAAWFRAWRSKHQDASPIHPASYLNQKRWQDEGVQAPALKPVDRRANAASAILSGKRFLCTGISASLARELVSEGVVTPSQCREVGVQI